MLILTRKQGERITVQLCGREVVLEVTKISGNKVRLGFDADRDINIIRNEAMKPIVAK